MGQRLCWLSSSGAKQGGFEQQPPVWRFCSSPSSLQKAESLLAVGLQPDQWHRVGACMDSIGGVMQQACCCACSQHPATVYCLHPTYCLPNIAVLQSRAACSIEAVQAVRRRARVMHLNWVLQGHVQTCRVQHKEVQQMWKPADLL